MNNDILVPQPTDNSFIKFFIGPTKGDWIFRLSIIIGIIGQIILMINDLKKKKIYISDLSVDGVMLFSSLLILYYHFRYRWQTIVIFIYSIFVIVKLIKTTNLWKLFLSKL